MSKEFYTYKQLSKVIQKQVIKGYQSGWLETHPNDPYSDEEAEELLSEQDDAYYDINGNYLEDE